MSRTRILGTLLVLGLGGVGLTSSSACSLVYSDVSSIQCRSQEDCLAKGPDFADTSCTVERVCQRLAVQDRACDTTAQCLERSRGQRQICRQSDKKCVPLLNQNCPSFWGTEQDVASDAAIFLGQLGPPNVDGNIAELGSELARDQLMQSLGGGLPPLKPGGPKRPLVIIRCLPEPTGFSPQGSLAETASAVSHLTNVVNVTAIIGNLVQASCVPTATDVSQRGFLELTTCAAAQLTPLADNDLVFRTNPSELLSAAGVSSFITSHVGPKIYSENIAATGEPIRLALIFTGDGTGVGASEVVKQTLSYNNKNAVDNQADGNFKVFKLANASDPVNSPNAAGVRSQVIGDVIAYKPHVVVWATTPGEAGLTFTPMQKSWPAGLPRPVHIPTLSSWGNFIIPELRKFNNDPTVTTRYYGMEAFPNDFTAPAFKVWTDAMQFKFPELTGQPFALISPGTHDAVYILSYAIAGLGDQPPTGANLSKILRRVGSPEGGLVTPWGGENASRGIANLIGGKNLAYVGPLGTYAWDQNGDRKNLVASANCPVLVNGTPSGLQRSGYRFNVEGKTMTAPVTNCP